MDTFEKFDRQCIIRGSSDIIITENGEAVLYKVSDNSKFMTSNIFAARITEYVPQLHSFFADIGDSSRRALLSESDGSFHIGDFCLVQVSTSPRGKKGAQITTKVRLTGVYSVLLPCEDNVSVNISAKIRNAAMRERLYMIGESFNSEYSMIFRTQSATASSCEISEDYGRLCRLWNDICLRFKEFAVERKVGPLFLNDPVFNEIIKYPILSYSQVCVDSPDIMEAVKSRFPELESKLRFIPNRIFAAKSVDSVEHLLLGRKVYLKSGADIVIETTEALTVIDVNSGKSRLSYRDVNFEAACEIMRQLRLRDIGGIIVCDFIEMDRKNDRTELIAYMRNLAFRDPARPEIPGLTSLGLMEISRKRS